MIVAFAGTSPAGGSPPGQAARSLAERALSVRVLGFGCGADYLEGPVSSTPPELAAPQVYPKPYTLISACSLSSRQSGHVPTGMQPVCRKCVGAVGRNAVLAPCAACQRRKPHNTCWYVGGMCTSCANHLAVVCLRCCNKIFFFLVETCCCRALCARANSD